MQILKHPIVAVVGSARREIMTNAELQARKAAEDIGAELARRGWSLAVYGSMPDYIEHDVVKGYLTVKEIKDKSIVCIYPSEMVIDFDGLNDHPNCFDLQPDTSADWEMSFYRSLFQMDGILLLGGKQSALIAGQISLSCDLPIVAVGRFPGAAQKIWREHLSKKPGSISDEDLQIMGRWDGASPVDLVRSLTNQYEKAVERKKKEKELGEDIRKKAQLYDEQLTSAKKAKKQVILALVFLIVFLACFILGLVVNWSDGRYVALCVIGLGLAGGMGATIRLLAPKPPKTLNIFTGPLLGVLVGLMFAIIYLIPQSIQKTGFLFPESYAKTDFTALRVQFVCAMVVSVLAGLAFDYSLQQLIKKGQSDPGKMLMGEK
ncbi:hypothetical protein A4D02_28790 [Niastella koreensis]|uniref:Uncharacterized protein n=2 Tax=Niastella koreensis TaxID=354356 RepID=G8T777_NIAKG|nr:hypothetical protein [Niastella koreensis]AEW00102.1 hypothetical protein Niako_3808 [Niastella koreensis GR20-10]OQP49590.1 hypothetical protein A4D02_28790 [Niastella koreensis]